MSILLDNTKIPGFQQKISATLSLAGQDISGNSSQSVQAETGDKPKAISIVTNIKYEDQNDLSLLIKLAEAKNDSDERIAYHIINNTAKAMNIRLVRFQGDMQIREMEETKAWTVSFKLIEYQSVPEKKEQRIADKKVKEQAAADQPIVPDATSTQTEPEKLTWFEENVLKKVDNTLA